MARSSALLIAVVAASLLSSGRSALAQGDAYKARLSPTPVESSTFAVVTGLGSATAMLSGTKLSVRGSFEGMKTPATIAQIHLGPRGVRGPVMFDLIVTKGSNGSGSFAGTFNLTPVQVEAVKGGRLYIQVHSEKAADGNLWGWLLPARPTP